MRGIILAGGTATRLRPLTWVTNKHLLPVYNKPMIYYPLEAMVRAGVEEVLIVTGPPHVDAFIALLKDGSEFGLKLTYEVQPKAGGISQGIAMGESFVGADKSLVLLGDNIFNFNLKEVKQSFEKEEKGAVVFGIDVPADASQYGIIEVDNKGKVISIEEKPQNPKSNIAQTGIYMYDNRVFNFIRELKPSARGELEVTDLNNMYVNEGTMRCARLNWWVDAGTSFDELLRANNAIAEKVRNGELN